MSSSFSSLKLHRYAISTLCVAFVTVLFGSLTTTKDAGMAFPRWLYSDDHLVPLYPWLQDFGTNWNKFLEHGHRLAGMLIGLWSIGLVALTWKWDQRRWVRLLSCAVLLGVICQGILGGSRVELNNRGLAMVHGLFAAFVISLMAAMAVVTSKGWHDSYRSRDNHQLSSWALAAVLALGAQYALGGLIRHHGWGLFEHLFGAGVAWLLVAANADVVRRHGSSWEQRSAWLLLAFTSLQVVLGMGAWLFKYGFAPWAIVPVMNSIEQVIMRTAHSMFGIAVFASAAMHVLKVYRVAYLNGQRTILSHWLSDRNSEGIHSHLLAGGPQ